MEITHNVKRYFLISFCSLIILFLSSCANYKVYQLSSRSSESRQKIINKTLSSTVRIVKDSLVYVVSHTRIDSSNSQLTADIDSIIMIKPGQTTSPEGYLLKHSKAKPERRKGSVIVLFPDTLYLNARQIEVPLEKINQIGYYKKKNHNSIIASLGITALFAALLLTVIFIVLL